MVKKATNSKLVINTAVKKEEPKPQTVINLSKVVSVPVTYTFNGKSMSMMLAPTTREVLPAGANLVTKSEYIKVV